MTNFEILVLIGFAGIIFLLFGIKRVLNKAERHLFGIRYQIPFVESADLWRLHEIKEANEESEGELDGWFRDCREGKKPLVLYELYELKTLVKSIEENLKRLNGERIKKEVS
jgi:hypothetical protein